MTTSIDSNKLLKKIAKERLKPHGIVQKGQSRTFLYDRGWFIVVIEFQPSSWSKGTYLNIGVDFNFYPREHFAFRYGYREKGFESFKDEVQFTKLMNELCDLTIQRVHELEQQFSDFNTALKTIEKDNENDTWRWYEIAILNALTSNFDKSRLKFEQVSQRKCEYDWEIERKKLVDEILERMQKNPNSLDEIKTLITKTRQLKKLAEITVDNINERNTTLRSSLPKANLKWWQKLFRNSLTLVLV